MVFLLNTLTDASSLDTVGKKSNTVSNHIALPAFFQLDKFNFSSYSAHLGLAPNLLCYTS